MDIRSAPSHDKTDLTAISLGFTGTQLGWSHQQRKSVILWIKQQMKFGLLLSLHHGDCVGADAAIHQLVEGRIPIHIHPPENYTKRAWCVGQHMYPETGYLERNRHIVDSTNMLLATPRGPEEQRSGTWSTVRYARRQSKPLVIAWPSGLVETFIPPPKVSIWH